MAAAFLRDRSNRLARAFVPATALLLLPIPFLLSRTAQYPHGFGREPNLKWAAPYVGLRLPPGFFEAASLLRERSVPTDVVMSATVYQCAPLEAIVERRVIFPEPCEPRSVTPLSTTPERPAPPNSDAARLLASSDYRAFTTMARARGINWLFLYATSPPADWIRENSVWHDGRIFLVPVHAG
jgi:hypothetical protein